MGVLFVTFIEHISKLKLDGVTITAKIAGDDNDHSIPAAAPASRLKSKTQILREEDAVARLAT